MPEIATRMAIGGGRGAIVRQLLAESVVLASRGGAAGIALGYAGSQLFASLLEHAFGVPPEVGLDWRVLLVTGGASLATSLLFGLFPAYQATRVNLREALVRVRRQCRRPREPLAATADGRRARSRSASCCWSARGS